MMKWQVNGTWQVLLKSSFFFFLKDFNGHGKNRAENFESVHGENGIREKNVKEDCYSSVMKNSCA